MFEFSLFVALSKVVGREKNKNPVNNLIVLLWRSKNYVRLSEHWSNKGHCYWPKCPRVVAIDRHDKLLLYLQHVIVA